MKEKAKNKMIEMQLSMIFKMQNATTKTKAFVGAFLEDILITLGMLLFVVATFIAFGLAPSLYVLGACLIAMVIVDFHSINIGRKNPPKGGEN